MKGGEGRGETPSEGVRLEARATNVSNVFVRTARKVVRTEGVAARRVLDRWKREVLSKKMSGRRATFHPPGGVLLLGRRSRFLRPHPERIAAAALAHGHAVAHGDVREVGVHGVALAVVAGSATVVFPARVRGWDTGPARHAAAFVRARDPGAGGQASVGGGRFHRGAAFARTHQCDSVISSSAAASKMVGPFSSSTLMTSGAFVACGGSGELCAPVASGQPRDRETGVFSNFPEARPARSTAGR